MNLSRRQSHLVKVMGTVPWRIFSCVSLNMYVVLFHIHFLLTIVLAWFLPLASKWSHLGIFYGIGGLQVPSFRFKISEHCLSRCAARNIEQFFHLRMCRSSLSRIKNKCREHCYVITHIEVQNLLDKCQGQLYVWSPKVM
jgi:hypothetical protein